VGPGPERSQAERLEGSQPTEITKPFVAIVHRHQIRLLKLLGLDGENRRWR